MPRLTSKAIDTADIVQCYVVFAEQTSMNNEISLEAIFC